MRILTGDRQPVSALGRYLQGHHLAARSGVELFERAARGQRDERVRERLHDLTEEVARDKDDLRELLAAFELGANPVLERVMILLGRVARLRPGGGSLLGRGPLSDLLELEALTAAVHAKRLGWVAMRGVADRDPRMDEETLGHLIERAEDQEARLESLRLDLVGEALGATALGSRTT